MQGIVNKKVPWSREELALMAREEARLTIEGVQFINQALLPIFNTRTLESIKGQRRNQKYKSTVLHIMEEMKNELGNTNPASTGDQNPQVSQLVPQIQELFSKLRPLKDGEFEAGRLDRICKNLSVWSTEKVFEEIEIYLLKIFPSTSGKRKAKGPQFGQTEVIQSRRLVRRIDYARTQKAWSRNPCKCLKVILKGKSAAQTPAKDIMVKFWMTTMTEGATTSPKYEAKRETLGKLWCPIYPDEVKAAFPANSTCPGPDGLTIRQLKAIPLGVITRVFNIFLLCGKVPTHLLKSKTTLIPKKDGAKGPEDFRPITVSSVLTRTFHKILAGRMTKAIKFDERQKAFLPKDGCAENIFNLDVILRYHRQHFKPMYIASMDIAKAFDSVSHKTIRDTIEIMGLPDPMIEYIMNVYERSTTFLKCDRWESDRFKPTCGVKQGDPMSPIIFNMVMDRLLRKIPAEIGVDIDGNHYNAFAFADDMIFVASTPIGLQSTIDIASEYLTDCGLRINSTKSFTVAIRNVPHVKKSVIDGKAQFLCLGNKLPALRREDEWRYLGVPFTPEGQALVKPEKELTQAIEQLSKAPLKPQQRMFALRVMVLPGLYHQLTLGNITLSRLKKVDNITRAAVRRWCRIPHDVANAYIHASAREGGMSIPSVRWLMPLHRHTRLAKLSGKPNASNSYIQQEQQKAMRRLIDGKNIIDTLAKLDDRWANMLHSACDGQGLKESRKVPQQNRWVTQGTRLVSGRDFINMIKFRINAMPTKSRTARGRIKDRSCRGGCRAIETLSHVSQVCHRTHRARIERHDAITAYVKRALAKDYDNIVDEPHFTTEVGLRKPDLIATKGNRALVIDTQIIGENVDLAQAHKNKIEKYGLLEDSIKKRMNVQHVDFTSVTLSYKGIWSAHSAEDLVRRNILKKKELAVISTRVLVGGLSSFWRFNRTTTTAGGMLGRRLGIG